MDSKIKEPVRLREKKLSNGNVSLYLDIYVNGKREYKFLKLYLIPEHTKQDKESNKTTLQLANAIKSKYIVDIQNGVYGFRNNGKGDVLFFDYFRSLMEEYKNRGQISTYNTWENCLRVVILYNGGENNLRFKDIDKNWVKGFIKFLYTPESNIHKKKFSQNTIVLYFSKLRACFRRAYTDEIIDRDVCKGIDIPKLEPVERNFLTEDEVRLLWLTRCSHDVIKRAFLFSCLTGLRKSDILNLRWSDVYQEPNGTKIVFQQKKTKSVEYTYITEQAVALMGQRGKDDELIFPFYKQYANQCIKYWVKRAGINKHISFHCARHTFAVMMLRLSNDIYMVSKLLGHRNIQTTQIYAKIVDDDKRDIVMKIPKLIE